MDEDDVWMTKVPQGPELVAERWELLHVGLGEGSPGKLHRDQCA
eukprot:CAMPEP_0179160302 /NCGR_PEP_ID=MMETSP0796-20121207/78357_1 /TAXON_ID=73915 /ORGANISM="Pyrodinium bahamense, Strain pbaha01" /LENGTH=43 /DNA_ID= /DNA_START= /DNA_END= /DNA_ORIENTATION=